MAVMVPWPGLLLRAMSSCPVVAEVCVSDLSYHQRPCNISGLKMPPEIVWMSEHSLACHQELTDMRGHDDIWPGLLPGGHVVASQQGSVLRAEIRVTPKGHADVSGLGCHVRPC